jgi:hypothetical protein
MSMQLRDDDRRAVDLLLDRPEDNPNDTPAKAPVAATSLQSAEKILNLLQQMPAMEPPADLAARTLLKVDQALAALGASAVQSDGNVAHRDQRPPAS